MRFVKLLRAQFIARRIFPEGATVEVDDALAVKLLERLDAVPVELTAEEPSRDPSAQGARSAGDAATASSPALSTSQGAEAATVSTSAPSPINSAPQREPVPKAARAKKGKRGR